MKDNIYVTLLKGARLKIESGEKQFICCAIVQMSEDIGLGSNEEDAQRLTRWIQDSLNRQGPLDCWLYAQGAVDCWNKDKVRIHRLAWIDRMIVEWRDVK